MNVFTLTTLIVDSKHGKAEMFVSLYSTVEKAKKDFDDLVNKQTDVFKRVGHVFSIDHFYNEGIPESEMTYGNCFALCISNEHGLSVQIEITEMPIQ